MNIDSFSFDDLKTNYDNDKKNGKPFNDGIPLIQETDESLNNNVGKINVFDGYEKYVLKKQKVVDLDKDIKIKENDEKNDDKKKRTGSDIYKSDESNNNNKKNSNISEGAFAENSIKNNEIKKKNTNNKTHLSTSENNNVIIGKYRNQLLGNNLKRSEYVEEINEEDIPEYDDIKEKIINASIMINK